MATTLEQLAASLRGRVRLPGDPGFDAARRPWNVAVDQQVTAVVEAADGDDVVSLVRYARAAGVPVATQPTGHGATGRTAGAILLRTGRLDEITVDPGARTAVVGAGLRSGDLQRAAAAHGLTAMPGSSPMVSVTGFVLGGGLSWFSRAFGWGSDSVRAFHVVDSQAAARTVTRDGDPDLSWALRGAGGDFVAVVAVELQLHPAPEVFGGRVLWGGEHRAAVAATFLDLTRAAPRELTLWLELIDVPGPGQMVAVDLTYLSPEAQGRALTAALDGLPAPLHDSRRAMSVADLATITRRAHRPEPRGAAGRAAHPPRRPRPRRARRSGGTAHAGAGAAPGRRAHRAQRQPARTTGRALRRLPHRCAERSGHRAGDRRCPACAGGPAADERSQAAHVPRLRRDAGRGAANRNDRPLRRVKEAVDPHHTFRANHSVLDVH